MSLDTPAPPNRRRILGSTTLTQMVVFETTFLVLAFANAFGYALVAARARGFVANPRAIGIVNKVGGGLLIGAGAATVTFAGSRS